NFINNFDLKSLLAKGAKFRTLTTFKTEDVISSIFKSLHFYTAKVALKLDLFHVEFMPWLHDVSKLLSNLVTKFENNNFISDKLIDTEGTNTISSSAVVYLKNLQRDFIIIPIDKSSNDLAFICKKHYCYHLHNELEQIVNTHLEWLRQ